MGWIWFFKATMTAMCSDRMWCKNSPDELAGIFKHNPIYRANQHMQPQAAFSSYKGFGDNSHPSSWHRFFHFKFQGTFPVTIWKAALWIVLEKCWRKDNRDFKSHQPTYITKRACRQIRLRWHELGVVSYSGEGTVPRSQITAKLWASWNQVLS